jgi:predicted aldo/keto reductase-like oxidoreductase
MGVLTIGQTQLNLGLEEGADLVRYALKRGINFLDTAEYYETYPYIKKALSGYSQADEIVIASKSLKKDAASMLAAVEDYRKTFNRDVADIFLMHELRGEQDFYNRQPAWECLCELKEKGVIKAIGISTHHVDSAMQNANIPESDILFPLINMSGLGIRKGELAGSKEEMAEAIRLNSEAGKGVFAMKAFGGGILTARYVEALDYVNALPGVDSMMVGIGTRGDVDNLVDYAEGTLPEGFAPDVTNKMMRIDQGDCEGCFTCIDRCTSNAIYKTESGTADINHELCITCGYCAPMCPVRAIIMY